MTLRRQRCEVSALVGEPRPPLPYRYDGDLLSLALLRVVLTDAALIGWDADLSMDETGVFLKSTKRRVRFPRALAADGVWDVSNEWEEL